MAALTPDSAARRYTALIRDNPPPALRRPAPVEWRRFEEKEIAEAKSGWLQSRQVGRAQDAPLARTLAVNLYIGRTLAWDAELEKKVQALTAADILAAMRRHIDPAKMTIVKAGDFQKGAAAPGGSK